MLRNFWLALTGAYCSVVSYHALADNEQKVQWHGFVAQGAIDADGSNFVNDDESASLALTELGINASYQLTNDIRLAGQATYLNGGNRYPDGFSLDYFLVDWSVFSNEKWQTNLYIGRIKNYHWLYSATRDVPMTRPSIILPQSVYFDATRNLSIGGDGAALTAKYFSDSYGDFDFNISSSESDISSEQSRILLGPKSQGKLKHNKDLQTSIYWQPDMSSWRFGLALTDADFSYLSGDFSGFLDGTIGLKRYYFNGEYHGEKWTFSYELLQETMEINGLLSKNFTRKPTGQGGFAQVEYLYNSDVKILARAEHYYADRKDKTGTKLNQISGGTIPQHFGYQHEFVVGTTVDLATNLQLQLEHHWIKGTARLTPVVIPNSEVNDDEYWQLAAIQFVYWF
ncbi:hypothetical protein [Thalassotalea marina]|uniref:Porin n=1 Tax=Thalassotalea marina TaxID=1673741 RepID=A0A919EMS2_9GAMM|nr:hypothetical protein [Thalassotalea marina]GHG04414.1 hypothetical protein GCM10017161_37450 [Thalassotalea marina]